MTNLLFVVQGLFEKSDSIGYDCVFQYKLAREHMSDWANSYIFAENFDNSKYPGIQISSISNIKEFVSSKDAIIIYHYCDGWEYFENFLVEFQGKIILRWHNNTPPWFFVGFSRNSWVERTIRGYENLIHLAGVCDCIVTNSAFTSKQLNILANERIERSRVVYPASRYLENRFQNAKKSFPLRKREGTDNGEINILFVSRIVPHKGHRHILQVAFELQKIDPSKVIKVIFAGRGDSTYVEILTSYADDLGIDLSIPGEVDESRLEELYDTATVFVCMSEHEGFGMPVYEAMSRNVPVVVWAGTAFAEMLDNHPLAFRTINHKMVAHGIYNLQDLEFRDLVIKYQKEEVLPKYTKEIVFYQLSEAITCVLNASKRKADFNKTLPCEIDGNFVTNYDLTAYKAFCDMNAEVSKKQMGHVKRKFLDPKLFLSVRGKIEVVPYLLHVPVGEVRKNMHLIFGPYIRLDKGAYSAEISISNINRADEKIRIEIASNGCVLEQVDVVVPGFKNGMSVFTVDFDIDTSDNLVYEVRIRLLADENRNISDCVNMLFYGVEIVSRKADLEVNARSFVESCYNNILGREPDESGLLNYIGALEKKEMSCEDVVSTLLTSEEARKRSENIGISSGNSSDIEAFVESCYLKILGRHPDESGFKHYVSLIKMGIMTPKEIAESISSSDEAKALHGLLSN